MKKKCGITIVEIIVATAVAAILAVPLMLLYQSGVKTSVSGVTSIEMLSEGRRIISQLHDDLKNSAIPFQGAFSLAFTDLLIRTSSPGAVSSGFEYSLYRFNREALTERKPFAQGAPVLTPLIHVRYSLEKNSNNELFKLVRTEIARNIPDRIKVLSERVAALEIRPVNFSTGSQNYFWNTTLELGHFTDNGSKKGNRPTMSFYDVVYSEFFNTLAQHPFSPRNWFSGMTFSLN